MISHNEEFVGALCPEQWHVNDGRLVHKGHLGIAMDRFEDGGSRPSSGFASPIPGFASPGLASPALAASSPGLASSAVSSVAGSPSPSVAGSAANSGDEGGEMKFKAKKKKKMTRAQMKDREVRRRLRHIEWLNSPKGTPKPPDSDDD